MWLLFEEKTGKITLLERKKRKTEIACDKKERQKKKRKRTFWLSARARKREREREMFYGATTRAQKRRAGERDVWDVIVNNDDICFEHILPRLNRTDVKFLFEVNTETRALVKRSSRKSELRKKFQVEEMSSISTLEIAWENPSLWPRWWDERTFCYQVAQTNKLELLKWIREEKKCKWDEKTIAAAANRGNMEMIKYCVANECPIDEWTCAGAAGNGHLECLKYLHEEAKAPWDWKTASGAAENGHLHILEYLVEREYDEFDENACSWAADQGQLDCLKFLHETAKAPWGSGTVALAAMQGHLHILEYLDERKYKYDEYGEEACEHAAWYGHLDCLKFLHETAKAPWDERAVRFAHQQNHSECLQYLLDNDCPLPSGWRYEHGTLTYEHGTLYTS